MNRLARNFGDSRAGSLANVAIRRPVGTLAVAFLVLLLGLYSMGRLPLDLLPQVEYPQIRVTVNYPGAAPEVMEQQVTRVLEQNLAAVENLVSLESRASEGRTNVNLFLEYGTDLDLAIQEASRYLELARTQMPPDIEPPRLYRFDPAQDPVFEAGFTSSTRTPAEVRDWLENRLAPQLNTVSGVGSVSVAGGVVREIQVMLDQTRLNSYGLGFGDVERALTSENVDVPAGQITSRHFDVMTRTDGRFRAMADIEQILLDVPGSDQRIPLTEVGQVVDGHQDQRIFARLNGQEATQLSVLKQPDANTVQVVEAVQARLDELQASGFITEDFQFATTRDPGHFIQGSVQAVATAAILGGVLAMILVLLFLGSLRRGLAIGLSIPIAVAATFALLGVSGLTLNVMSLGGLALGVGLLLDNAIVMSENIARHRQQLGKSPEQAAHEGSREVFSAVLAATLTNLAAVIPFLLVTGVAALLFRELILTISFAIIASLAAAVTLVPMLTALLAHLRWQSGLSESLPIRGFAAGLTRATRGYQALLRRAVRVPWLVVALAVALLGSSAFMVRDLGSDFLPPVDDGRISAHIRLPSGTPPEATLAAAQTAEQVIDRMPHVESVFSLVGGHLHGGILNIRNATARFSIQLAPGEERPDWPAERWVRELQRELDAQDFPGGRVTVRPPSLRSLRLGPSEADISVGVIGDDLAALDTAGREIVQRLEGLPGLTNVEIARDDRTPMVSIHLDRERAKALGVTADEAAQAARVAVDGITPTRFSTPNADYDIRLRLPPGAVTTSDGLGDITVLPDNGVGPVHLREIAEFVLGDSPAHIERENQTRILRVEADVDRLESDLGRAGEQVREALADFELPDGYNLLYGGADETVQETRQQLAQVVALALLLVFTVLAVQYERLVNPLVILATAPLALTGALLALWLTGTPFTTPVMLGAVVLIGIVVNNAILLVEYIEIGRRDAGLSDAEAAVEAGGVRLRPILMTTLTTVAGMTPLAIGMGAGSDLMQPLALVVVGGLLSAMLLTLFVVPCLYLIAHRLGEGIKRWLTGRVATA